MTTHLCEERGELLPMLRDVRPTFFFAPPGIWDAFRTAVRPLASDGNTRPHHGMLSRIGLDECRLPITAAAPIAPDLLSFFHGLGLDISEAWGMTECGVGTWNLGQTRGGTVGPTLPGLEGRIDRDGELLVRGGAVMAGYYRDPEQTAEAVDPEGWLHTGDLAEVDEDDCYRILGRKKDLIITPFGKNICPTDLENLLKAHPLIREAAVFGDARPFLTALLVLDEQAAAGWAREHGLESAPPESLAENADLLNEVRQAVGSVNRQLSGPEQIQRFTVLPVEWSVENGELTPTLKIRRSVIGEKFARDIARMYGDGLSS